MSVSCGPAFDELEIVLIGPGFGESVLVHIGDGRWIVVDSCRDSDTGNPAPLEYFRRIGVDPAKAVDLIVASHWHDDHIRDLGVIVEACTSARFCCSSALTKEEFVGLVAKYEDNTVVPGGSGVRELYKIFSLLASKSATATMATADKRILMLDQGRLSHGLSCEVWSLSPSDQEINDFFVEVSSLMPNVRETKYRIPQTNKNDLSVVLWVSVGDDMILLGGDLEEHGNQNIGWSAIVASVGRPHGFANVFKVPHHGSATGHCEDVWRLMVAEDAYSIVSPFNRGRKKLPSVEDIKRISGYTENIYVTSFPRSRTSKRRDRAIERTVREVVGRLHPVEADTGYIRLRKKLGASGDDWAVELSGRACPASDFVERLQS